jgi:1-phosphofructokinase
MTGSVMVFAPTPVLTVTIEHRSDDALDLHVHPGGQGVWQARMARALGARVTLCAVLGGETGSVVAKLLADEDLTVRTVSRPTGNGWYVHDRRDDQRTEVADAAGAPLARHELDELYNLALAEGLRAGVSLLSGPDDPSNVDPDVYRRLATDLAANGVRVVADLSGAHLSAALAGGPAFVKVSHEEAISDGLAEGEEVDDLVAAAHRLRDKGARAVLVSHAGEPSVALVDDKAVLVRVPRLEAADPRGAGDSLTAGVAAVLARDGGYEDAIRTGAAAGALNVTRHGLGTGRLDAIQELVGRVSLEPLA